MAWISGAIAAGGAVLGGLTSARGQAGANAMNYRIAKENREWQERMSNTAHQRATKDLEAAGLNRILALGQPASTPAGNVATMQNEKAALGQGIQQAAMNAAQIQLIKAQTATAKAQAGSTQATEENTRAQTSVIAPAASAGGTAGNLVDKATSGYTGAARELGENST